MAARRGACGSPVVGARGRVLDFQRGLFGYYRRRLDAACAVRGRLAPRSYLGPARAPNEPEVHGLVALMEIQASRSAARVGPSGEPSLLLEQNRGRWDQLRIRRGFSAFEPASKSWAALAGRSRCRPRLPRVTPAPPRQRPPTGHASRLYTTRCPCGLRRRSSSSIAGGGRGHGLWARSRSFRSTEPLLVSEPSLQQYHLLPAVRAGLARRGESSSASEEGTCQSSSVQPRSLTQNARERALPAGAAPAACHKLVT